MEPAAGSARLRVGFVGAGRMAEAIAQGLIRAGAAAGPVGESLVKESAGLGGRGAPRRVL